MAHHQRLMGREQATPQQVRLIASEFGSLRKVVVPTGMAAEPRRQTGTGCVHQTSGSTDGRLLPDDKSLSTRTLYWITLQGCTQEAFYLLAIINSDALYQIAVTPLMPKGQFGARDLHISTCGSCRSRNSTRATRCTSRSPRLAKQRRQVRPNSWNGYGKNAIG